MIAIKTVENKGEKTRITLEVMNALPEWFSPPEDIVNKSVIHREYHFIAAFDGSKAVGFVVLKIHNEYTADSQVFLANYFGAFSECMNLFHKFEYNKCKAKQ